ncbi:glycosyltransferase [Cryobacterium sp. 10I1]|uniref:glycosyltransferase family 2 protein n=1 Tax=unclassified Cryobacterium TaxID=2649013 RepID=UPI002B22A9B7|nr:MULTISPECIES: glycosyltransferase [unclassified Cryobacterium]MEB0001337.1 glycosyltransferase [Cryobacterium sp. RTC2.1]MEB0303949.1 glycosyltransferase [Cryobacterium sp. 10I1]
MSQPAPAQTSTLRNPFFSVLTPVYNAPVDVLQETIDSVLGQSFRDWELVLVDDCSPDPAVRELLRRASERDERIRVIERVSNGGIVQASNDAIDAARGTFLALLDHDDLLAPRALKLMYEVIRKTPGADYVYSDEDKLGAGGEYYDQFDKPDWSPERLRGQMYTGHLSVLRTDLVREVGGFRSEFEGSQDHDLVLRVTEQARQIVHIPEVLYHWRVIAGSTAADPANKPYTWDAGVRAVNAHLARVGIAGVAYRGVNSGTYRIEREPELKRSVSVIIPTRGTAGFVWGQRRVFVVEAVRSVLAKTRHEDLEIVVVHDTDTPAEVLTDLVEIAGDRLTLVPFDRPFNFSRKCNEGFLAARGDVLIFLNDDTQVISDEFIGDLISPLNEPDVGMTGAKLLFEDGFIQHAGHLHHMGQFTHAYMGSEQDSFGAFCSLIVNRESSGLTAACVAMPRSVFTAIGGFSELFPGSFNDVDLCKKVDQAGFRLVWLANLELFHFESRSRNPTVHSFEDKMIFERWGRPGRDPYLF